jgi:hypothetical protein
MPKFINPDDLPFNITIHTTRPRSPYGQPDPSGRAGANENEALLRAMEERNRNRAPAPPPQPEVERRGSAGVPARLLQPPNEENLQIAAQRIREATQRIRELQQQERYAAATLELALQGEDTIGRQREAIRQIEALRARRAAAQREVMSHSAYYENERTRIERSPYYTSRVGAEGESRLPPSPPTGSLVATHVNTFTYDYRVLQNQYDEFRGGLHESRNALPQPPVASRNPTDWGRYQETYQRAYQEEHWARLQREVAGGRDPLYALWRFGDKEVADFLGKPENYPFINRVTEEIQRKTGPGVVRGERQQDWAVNLARESALRREEIERQAPYPQVPSGNRLTGLLATAPSDFSQILARLDQRARDAERAGQPDPFWGQIAEKVRTSPQWSLDDYHTYLSQNILPVATNYNPDHPYTALVRQDISELEARAEDQYRQSTTYQSQVAEVDRRRSELEQQVRAYEASDPHVQFVDQYDRLMRSYQPRLTGISNLVRAEDAGIASDSPNAVLRQYGFQADRPIIQRQGNQLESELRWNYTRRLLDSPRLSSVATNDPRVAEAARGKPVGTPFERYQAMNEVAERRTGYERVKSRGGQEAADKWLTALPSPRRRFYYVPQDLTQPFGYDARSIGRANRIMAGDVRAGDDPQGTMIGRVQPDEDILLAEAYRREQARSGRDRGYPTDSVPTAWDAINNVERMVLGTHIDPQWDGGATGALVHSIRGSLAEGGYTRQGRPPEWSRSLFGRDLEVLRGRMSHGSTLDLFTNLQGRIQTALEQMEEQSGYRNTPLSDWYGHHIATEGPDWQRGPYNMPEAVAIASDLRGVYLDTNDRALMQRVDPDYAAFTRQFANRSPQADWVWNPDQQRYDRQPYNNPLSYRSEDESLHRDLDFGMGDVESLKASRDPMNARILEMLLHGELAKKMKGLKGRSEEAGYRGDDAWVAISAETARNRGIYYGADKNASRRQQQLGVYQQEWMRDAIIAKDDNIVRVQARDARRAGVAEEHILSAQGDRIDIPRAVAEHYGFSAEPNADLRILGQRPGAVYVRADAANRLGIQENEILASSANSAGIMPLSIADGDVQQVFLRRFAEAQTRAEAGRGFSERLGQTQLQWRMRGSRDIVRRMRDALGNAGMEGSNQGLNDPNDPSSHISLDGYRRQLRDRIRRSEQSLARATRQGNAEDIARYTGMSRSQRGQLSDLEGNIIRPFFGARGGENLQTMSLGLEGLAGAMGYRDDMRGGREVSNSEYTAGVLKNIGNILTQASSRGQATPSAMGDKIGALLHLGTAFRETGFIDVRQADRALRRMGWDPERDPNLVNIGGSGSDGALFLPGVVDRVHWSTMHAWRGEAAKILQPGDTVQVQDPNDPSKSFPVQMGLLARSAGDVGKFRDFNSIAGYTEHEHIRNDWLLPKSWSFLASRGYGQNQFLNSDAEREAYRRPGPLRDLVRNTNRGAFFEGHRLDEQGNRVGGSRVYSVADIAGMLDRQGRAHPLGVPESAPYLKWPKGESAQESESHAPPMRWDPESALEAGLIRENTGQGRSGSGGRYDAYLGRPITLDELAAQLPEFHQRLGNASRELAGVWTRTQAGDLNMRPFMVPGTQETGRVIPLDLDDFIRDTLVPNNETIAGFFHNHPRQNFEGLWQAWGGLSKADLEWADTHPNTVNAAYEPGAGRLGGFVAYGKLDAAHMPAVYGDFMRHGVPMSEAAWNPNFGQRVGLSPERAIRARQVALYRDQMGGIAMPGSVEPRVSPPAEALAQNRLYRGLPASLARRNGRWVHDFIPGAPSGQDFTAQELAERIRQGYHAASPEESARVQIASAGYREPTHVSDEELGYKLQRQYEELFGERAPFTYDAGQPISTGRSARPGSILKPGSNNDILDDWTPGNVQAFIAKYGEAGARALAMEGHRAFVARQDQRAGRSGPVPFDVASGGPDEQNAMWHGLGGGRAGYEMMEGLGRSQERGWQPDVRVRARYLGLRSNSNDQAAQIQEAVFRQHYSGSELPMHLQRPEFDHQRIIREQREFGTRSAIQYANDARNRYQQPTPRQGWLQSLGQNVSGISSSLMGRAGALARMGLGGIRSGINRVSDRLRPRSDDWLLDTPHEMEIFGRSAASSVPNHTSSPTPLSYSSQDLDELAQNWRDTPRETGEEWLQRWASNPSMREGASRVPFDDRSYTYPSRELWNERPLPRRPGPLSRLGRGIISGIGSGLGLVDGAMQGIRNLHNPLTEETMGIMDYERMVSRMDTMPPAMGAPNVHDSPTQVYPIPPYELLKHLYATGTGERKEPDHDAWFNNWLQERGSSQSDPFEEELARTRPMESVRLPDDSFTEWLDPRIPGEFGYGSHPQELRAGMIGESDDGPRAQERDAGDWGWMYDIPQDERQHHLNALMETLNPEQRAAVEHMMRPGSRTMLQAPPGTGKSFSIAASLLGGTLYPPGDPRRSTLGRKRMISSTNASVRAFSKVFGELSHKLGLPSGDVRDFAGTVHSFAMRLVRGSGDSDLGRARELLGLYRPNRPAGKPWSREDMQRPYGVDDRFRQGRNPTEFDTHRRTLDRVLGEEFARQGYGVYGLPQRSPVPAEEMIGLRQINDWVRDFEKLQLNDPAQLRETLTRGGQEASRAGAAPSFPTRRPLLAGREGTRRYHELQ